MDDSIGLRIYAAAHITVGAIIGSIGSFIGSAGTTSGHLDASILGIAAWIAFFFAAVVIALKGIVVLIEEAVQTTG